MTDDLNSPVDSVLSGYDKPYDSEQCDSVMLNNLFSKYGFADGNDPRADTIHKALSEHLLAAGYPNKIIGSVHNRRVSSVEINGKWYTTENLPWGEDWILLGEQEEDMHGNENDQIPAPEQLKQSILEFLPIGYKMMRPDNLRMSDKNAKDIDNV